LICISTRTESNLNEAIDKLRKIPDEIKKEKEISELIDASNVIQLNIDGEIIFTTRQTLISLPKSLFSILFNGRWEQKWHQDQNRNIYFDFIPFIKMIQKLSIKISKFNKNQLVNQNLRWIISNWRTK